MIFFNETGSVFFANVLDNHLKVKWVLCSFLRRTDRLLLSPLADYDQDEDYIKSFSVKERKNLMKDATKGVKNKEANSIDKNAFVFCRPIC